MWSQEARYSSLWCSKRSERFFWPLCLWLFELPQSRLSQKLWLVDLWAIFFCWRLFKDLQEVAQPQVHPLAWGLTGFRVHGNQKQFSDLRASPNIRRSSWPIHRSQQPPPLKPPHPSSFGFLILIPESYCRHLLPFTLLQISFPEHPRYTAHRVEGLLRLLYSFVLLSFARVFSPLSA